MNRTIEQLAFRNEVASGTSSIVLEAVAGSGKTTCLLDAVEVTGTKTVMICAFNKSIATELQNRLKNAGYDWKKAQASTVHAIGFGALRKAFPNIKVDANKVYAIIDLYLEQKQIEAKEISSIIKNMVSYAKQAGIGFLHPISDRAKYREIIEHFDAISSDDIDQEEVIDHTIAVLKLSNNMVDVVDFDDMVYLPLLKKCRFWQFDVVMVDEAQDINATRREMIKMITKRGGRVIAVGDRKQAIYGFSGADSNSLDLIQQEFNAKQMPLTVCFRCDKDIIKFAQTWNPVIQAFEKKEAGVVREMNYEDFLKMDLSAEDAMLCRNTKPLVEAAFALLKQGKAVKVEGRDIGEGLKKLATRWKIVTTSALVDKLTAWKEREFKKFMDRKQETKAQDVEDRFETLMIIIDRCNLQGKKTVKDVIETIDGLFEDTDGLKKKVFTLATIHRSKGREWKKIFWMDRKNTIPSKYAKQAWQIEQENNLAYVAATRAEHELIEVIK